jgi:hypothetical protein
MRRWLFLSQLFWAIMTAISFPPGSVRKLPDAGQPLAGFPHHSKHSRTGLDGTKIVEANQEKAPLPQLQAGTAIPYCASWFSSKEGLADLRTLSLGMRHLSQRISAAQAWRCLPQELRVL